MTDWSADPWFAEHAWVAPRVGETRRSGFKSLRPHAFSLESGEIGPDCWLRPVRVFRSSRPCPLMPGLRGPALFPFLARLLSLVSLEFPTKILTKRKAARETPGQSKCSDRG